MLSLSKFGMKLNTLFMPMKRDFLVNLRTQTELIEELGGCSCASG